MKMDLENEFSGVEGSFLFELRGSFKWDHQAFVHLMTELFKECVRVQNHTELSKTFAEATYYLVRYTQQWSEHFPKNNVQAYYDKAYELIAAVADFYFL